MGQIVIQTPSVEARNGLRVDRKALPRRGFPGADIFVKLLDIGPPVGRPVRFRINGTGIDALRDPARRLAAVMAGDDRLDSIVMDCNEPIRAVRVEIPGDQARRPGISQSDIGSALATIYEGAAITELRDGQYDGRFLVDIVARGDAASRARPNACPAFSCPLATGGQPCCGRWSGSTGMWSSRWCISATGGPRSPLPSRGARATIVADLSPQIDDLAATLPAGSPAEAGGTVETSGDSQALIVAAMLCLASMWLIGVVALLPSGLCRGSSRSWGCWR